MTATPHASHPGRTSEAPASLAEHSEATAFLGLTKTDCPVDCVEDRCVITHGPFCGHPCKGAMQPVHQADRAVLQRFNQARKIVAMEMARLKADRGDL